MRRLYTLYKRPRHSLKGARWIHCGLPAYKKDVAVRVFQDHLLAPYMGGDTTHIYELRRIKEGKLVRS